MKYLKFIGITLCVLFISSGTMAKGGGYLNKKNEVTFDLLSYPLSGELGLDYKFSPGKHLSLTLDLKMMSDFGLIYEYENGYLAGAGILLYGPTGMPAPMGYYFGGKVDVMMLDFAGMAFRARAVAGRDYPLGKGFVLDVCVDAGADTYDDVRPFIALRMKVGYSF